MFMKLATAILSILISYYLGIILHEWGHGLVAWLLGYKTNPFDVDYGGWFLLNVDESVPYNQILAAGQGFRAAWIGIAGLFVSLSLFIFCWISLKKIKSNAFLYSFFYWFAVVNLVPIFQYLTVQAFSIEGDVGRFTHGLAISPWWIFWPGTAFVSTALYHFFRYLVPKAYAILSISSVWMQRLFLLISLIGIFLWIYLHGYNPLSDPGMPEQAKILALFSMLLVPLLFLLCNPSHSWVKREISKYIH
jgi:hypothetical protein